jgi:CO/xanthine dehydrogenase FAD-binding subunit
MGIRDDELLTRIRLPRSAEPFFHYYRKVGTRKAQAISKICFAGVLRRNGKQIDDVRIAVGSVAPIPLRCVQTENVLRGQTVSDKLIEMAVKQFSGEISPIDDIRSTKDYRLRVAQNLLADFLTPESR